jgi:hypothetical protein
MNADQPLALGRTPQPAGPPRSVTPESTPVVVESIDTRMIAAMRIIMIVAAAAAFVGLLPLGSLSQGGSRLAVGLIVATPLMRVCGLAVRWWRLGDRRFALVALGVAAVAACGAAIVLLAG